MMQDKQGRRYADITKLGLKTVLEDDGGMNCLGPKLRHVVFFENERPFVFCTAGKHFLDGQTDDGIHCVGFYKID